MVAMRMRNMRLVLGMAIPAHETTRGREEITKVDAITKINSSGEGVTTRTTGWKMTSKTMVSR